MTFLNDFVMSSPVMSFEAGEEIVEGRHCAVMFDESGSVVLADSAVDAFGILLSTTPVFVEKGEAVSVLVKDIAYLEVEEEISAGDFVSVNENGKGVKAEEGDVVFGRAVTSVYGSGLVQVQIQACGVTLGGV